MANAILLTILSILSIVTSPQLRPEEQRGAPDSSLTSAEIERFWQGTLERAAREPLEANVARVDDPLPYHKYRVTYRSLGGVKIRAYLAVPVLGEISGSAERGHETGDNRLPAIITAPGYGGREQGVMLDDCMRGYVILQVYPRSMGESEQFWKIDGPDKLTWHIHEPEGYYLQGAYVDVIRGIDYLASREDVDGSRIGAMGTSMGGGVVLAVGALDQRVKTVVAHLPFMCDMRRAARIPDSLLRTLLAQYHSLDNTSLDTLDYFDPLNLAYRLRVPVLMSAGGRDTTCPLETVCAVFDKLPGIKSLVIYPMLPHTTSGDFYAMSWDWMDRHLKL
jgi:cephalosporin-C deacetylase